MAYAVTAGVDTFGCHPQTRLGVSGQVLPSAGPDIPRRCAAPPSQGGLPGSLSRRGTDGVRGSIRMTPAREDARPTGFSLSRWERAGVRGSVRMAPARAYARPTVRRGQPSTNEMSCGCTATPLNPPLAKGDSGGCFRCDVAGLQTAPLRRPQGLQASRTCTFYHHLSQSNSAWRLCVRFPEGLTQSRQERKGDALAWDSPSLMVRAGPSAIGGI